VLPRPSDPRLHESYVQDATTYDELARDASGPITGRVDFSYPWGDALEELNRVVPDARIVNLETAVTDSDTHWKGKGIHYRMHPANIPCIEAAGIDCCVLANNHVLDWGLAGLRDTLESLGTVGAKAAGAGSDRDEAAAPAVLAVPGKGRVLVFAFASPTSGVPRDWAATRRRAGVNYLADLSREEARRIAVDVRSARRQGDIVIVSIHWGSNWGYAVPDEQRDFAHWLIDDAGADVVHGHSSHHPKGIEIHSGRPILYGCGDFLNDYEGIRGHERYRGDLVLMYLVTMEPSSGELVRFEMVPFRIRRFRLERASRKDARWLSHTMNRECEPFGARVTLNEGHRLTLST
jgi:poly-gamma-glutamate synthesis protein (capsule biosynthesis protein)